MAQSVILPVSAALNVFSAAFTVAPGATPSFYLVGSAEGVQLTGNDVIRIHRLSSYGYYTPIRDITGDDKGEAWYGVGTFKAQRISGNIGFESEG